MGAKLYANPTTKELIVTQTPDGFGFVYLDVQTEVWSDLIVDWENDINLRKFTFPLVAIGGQVISSGKLGTTYVLLTPWQIAPYEADQDFDIDGNLFTESALTKLVKPTIGPYTVTVTRNVSTLVEVVETVDAGVIYAAIARIEASQEDDQSMRMAQHITDPDTHQVILRNNTDLRRWEADAWQDDDRTIPYNGNGLAVADDLVEVAWS